MTSHNATRLKATVTDWKPDRYYGFLYPDYGFAHHTYGNNIFIHGGKFDRAGLELPQVGDVVDVDVGRDHEDRFVALDVRRPEECEAPDQHVDELTWERNGSRWRLPVNKMNDGRMNSCGSPQRVGPIQNEPDPEDNDIRKDPRLARLSEKPLKVYDTLRIYGEFRNHRIPLNTSDIADFAELSENETSAEAWHLYCQGLLEREKRYPPEGKRRFYYWLSDDADLEELLVRQVEDQAA